METVGCILKQETTELRDAQCHGYMHLPDSTLYIFKKVMCRGFIGPALCRDWVVIQGIHLTPAPLAALIFNRGQLCKCMCKRENVCPQLKINAASGAGVKLIP